MKQLQQAPQQAPPLAQQPPIRGIEGVRLYLQGRGLYVTGSQIRHALQRGYLTATKTGRWLYFNWDRVSAWGRVTDAETLAAWRRGEEV